MHRTMELDQILQRLIDTGRGPNTVPLIEAAALRLLSDPARSATGFDLNDLFDELRRAAHPEVGQSIRTAISEIVQKTAQQVTFRENGPGSPWKDTDDLFYRIAHAHEGTLEERRARYAPIAELVRPGERVVDIGCGDGIFLDLIRERGAEGIGIDVDPEKVERVRAKGFQAFCGRAQELDWAWGDTDFVSMLHIVEHIPSPEVIAILARAAQSLSARGRLFMLTPNISHPTVQTNFWLDVTHVRPYPQLLLDTIVAQLGFPFSQSGSMTMDLETWCYGYRRAEDGVFGEHEAAAWNRRTATVSA